MPKEFSRIDRVADLIQKELSQIIQREMKDPRVGMITVLNVKISKDLAHAKVFVNVFPDDAATKTLQTLNQASGFLRGALAKRVKIYKIPALLFIYDDSAQKSDRLSRLIDEAVQSDKSNSNNNPS